MQISMSQITFVQQTFLNPKILSEIIQRKAFSVDCRSINTIKQISKHVVR